jgi:guanylate kinase
LTEKGTIIAVSAPSGAGKTTIVKRILKEFPEIIFSVSATTRKKRDNETDGTEYFFLTEEEFLKKIAANEFVEWEKVYDYYYGTLKAYVENAVSGGKSIILEVDVKGAISIKGIFPEAVLVYIVPPSLDELEKRLRNRQTESESDFNKRIARAKMELELKEKFDYFIENSELEKAVEDTKSLIKKIIYKEKVNGN